MTDFNHSSHWKLRILNLLLATLVIGAPSYLHAAQAGGTDDALKLPAGYKRDPFWPTGYVPENLKTAAVAESKPVVVKPTEANDWNRAMRKLVINGVSSRANNDFFAVINGQVKSVGDTVTINHEGTVYTWAVESIKPPGSVKLRRVSAL